MSTLVRSNKRGGVMTCTCDPGIPCECQWSPPALLPTPSLLLPLGKQPRMVQGLEPCRPHGRSERSSRRLAAAWPCPGHDGHFRTISHMGHHWLIFQVHWWGSWSGVVGTQTSTLTWEGGVLTCTPQCWLLFFFF